MSLEFDIAKRYMRSHHGYGIVSVISTISILGVIIGTAALVVVLSVMNGFESEVRTRIIGTGADILVAHVTNYPIKDWEEAVETVKKVDKVMAVSPIIFLKCAIASKIESDGIVVRGVIPEMEKNVSSISEYMLTKDLSFETDDSSTVGVWLGSTLADRLGVSLDDKIKLFSLKEAVSSMTGLIPKAMSCQVTGVFETGMYEYDSNLAYIPLKAAQSLFNMGNTVTNLAVKTNDFYKASDVAIDIEDALGYNYYSLDWKDMNKNLFSWITLEKWATFLTLSLIIAVAAFNIISSLIMVVLEKRKDIGVLMTLGMSSPMIRKIFIYQGTAIGAFGSIVGCLLGYILCYLQLEFRIISLPKEYYFINSLPIEIQFLDYICVALAAFTLSFLATIYPATRAAGLNPVEAIRYE
ncbi:MAG: lipoprotein-releasing ABC transporter permease subunit [candidate division Zixibacteria bacterium]|nr:lipoprotein-releasing ABC transporter permease subunit [candidate division Zixibacteria bacterium]